jgi:hypothetical protein
VARWTGEPGIDEVLKAADAWRERCFVGSTSILTDRPLWTVPNFTDLLKRYADNPIAGTKRDFLDKLEEQLRGAPPPVIQLAAEVMWFVLLFPNPTIMRQDTKREHLRKIWSWSGEQLPQSPFLEDGPLSGVGNPGTAYFTHRYREMEYLIRVVTAFKSLSAEEQRRLMQEDAPWTFDNWLEGQDGSDRRLMRNALLYFLFPDDLERNLSNDHRQQIYEALKGKLPPDQRIRSRVRKGVDYDKAILNIRRVLAKERGTNDIDFYQDDIRSQWFSSYRENKRKDFTAWLDEFLTDRGLRLNQSGRDTSMKKLRDENSLSSETGYWADDSGLTAKPPRWIIHFDLSGATPVASVPNQHRSRVIGFANTKGGDSGALAVRILPVTKAEDGTLQPIETWEWLLLFCFPGALKSGSTGQAFDDFDPATGKLTYMAQPASYIFSGLLCLNAPDDIFTTQVAGAMKTVTYRDATEALGKLINVDVAGKKSA